MTLLSENTITLITAIPHYFMLWFIVHISHMCCMSTHLHLSFIICFDACWVWDHWSLTPFWVHCRILTSYVFLHHFVWIWSNINSPEETLFLAVVVVTFTNSISLETLIFVTITFDFGCLVVICHQKREGWLVGSGVSRMWLAKLIESSKLCLALAE